MLRAQPLLYHQQQQHLHCNLYTLKAAPRPSFTCQATRRTGKKNDLEADLAELQRLAASGGQQQQQLVDTRSSTTRLQNEAVQIRKLLANVSAKSSKLSVKQLCRFAFILSRLQQTEVNTKPLWQVGRWLAGCVCVCAPGGRGRGGKRMRQQLASVLRTWVS